MLGMTKHSQRLQVGRSVTVELLTELPWTPNIMTSDDDQDGKDVTMVVDTDCDDDDVCKRI